MIPPSNPQRARETGSDGIVPLGRWRRLVVALVYPPFGPAALPSLGLALLAAQIRRIGHTCSVQYWNLDVVNEMPGFDVRSRLAAYRTLTERTWHPYSEWTFAQALYGDDLAERDHGTAVDLLNHALAMPDELLSAEALLALRADAARIVSAAVDRLAGADVVGIGTTFFQNIPALALARAVKERWPEKIVVLGGANCDGEMGPTLFRSFPFLDAVFVGEADHSIVGFLDAIALGNPPDDVAGVVWRDRDGVAHANCPGLPTTALDALPHADYSDWLSERDRVGVSGSVPLVVALESSRGCWWGAKHHCTFCGLNAGGMNFRQKSVDRMLAELDDVLTTTGAGFVFMSDNILSMNLLARLPEWPSRIGRSTHFFYEVKANLRPDQLRTLAKAGVTTVQPGIESLSTDALALMRKGVTAIQNISFLRSAQEVGICAAWNLLAGFPGEDPNWYSPVLEQIPRLTHLRPPSTVAQVEFHRFSPYHDDPSSFGLALRPIDSYRALYPFDEDVLAGLAYMFQPVDENPKWSGHSYLEALRTAVAAWHRAYATGNARLVAYDDGPDVVVDDTRPSFGPRTVRLMGLAAELHRLLAQPRSVSALVTHAENLAGSLCDFLPTDLVRCLMSRPHELPMGFGTAAFLRDPEAALAALVNAGLLYEERGTRQRSYLALAIPSSAAPLVDVWADTGV